MFQPVKFLMWNSVFSAIYIDKHNYSIIENEGKYFKENTIFLNYFLTIHQQIEYIKYIILSYTIIKLYKYLWNYRIIRFLKILLVYHNH